MGTQPFPCGGFAAKKGGLFMTKTVETTIENLRRRGFAVSYFDTAKEAALYLNSAIDGQSIGVGGSVTLQEMGLYDLLHSHNTMYWHWYAPEGTPMEETHKKAATADIYLSSVNAIAETGEIINIDGTGNRVASTLYGHKKLYLVSGTNKIAETYDAALWRARNVAGPKNAQRLKKNTPCAARGDRCYDCASPERICKGLVVLWEPLRCMETEVVLIGEELGY